MSDDYTPTTDEVRCAYNDYMATDPEDFNRWLDNILDEARWAAWENGWTKGAMSEKSFLGNKMSWERKNNPYRKATQ